MRPVDYGRIKRSKGKTDRVEFRHEKADYGTNNTQDEPVNGPPQK